MKSDGAPAIQATFAIGDERVASHIVDTITESYPSHDLAIAAFEGPGGRWDITMHFAVPPDETIIRALVAQTAGEAAAKTIVFSAVETKDWVEGQSRRSCAGTSWAFCGSRSSRSRPHSYQQDRNRNRSRAGIRHRPSRNDARLPDAARSGVAPVYAETHSGFGIRNRRSRHRCREKIAASGSLRATSMRRPSRLRTKMRGSTVSGISFDA